MAAIHLLVGHDGLTAGFKVCQIVSFRQTLAVHLKEDSSTGFGSTSDLRFVLAAHVAPSFLLRYSFIVLLYSDFI